MRSSGSKHGRKDVPRTIVRSSATMLISVITHSMVQMAGGYDTRQT